MPWKSQRQYPGYMKDTTSVTKDHYPSTGCQQKKQLKTKKKKKKKEREGEERMSKYVHFVEQSTFNSESVISNQRPGHHKPFCQITNKLVP